MACSIRRQGKSAVIRKIPIKTMSHRRGRFSNSPDHCHTEAGRDYSDLGHKHVVVVVGSLILGISVAMGGIRQKRQV